MRAGNAILEHNVDMISVLYEDADVLAINKPDGVLVHDDGEDRAQPQETVVEWFLGKEPSVRGVGESGRGKRGEALERSGIVHRLDRETSGVMILAKTQASFAYLKHQFQTRSVEKEYRAFVYGSLKERWGRIDRPIGRSAKDFRLRSAQRGARGPLREAVTDWELIGQTAQHAYIRLFPKTGRTHQIRVHLKAINHPVVCDRLYAPAMPCDLGFERLALHAHTLGITLPSGEARRFVAPLPACFTQALDAMSVDV